jgi:hypothetical protein
VQVTLLLMRGAQRDGDHRVAPGTKRDHQLGRQPRRETGALKTLSASGQALMMPTGEGCALACHREVLQCHAVVLLTRGLSCLDQRTGRWSEGMQS